jgi:purine-binding chemotaxis protein CheW
MDPEARVNSEVHSEPGERLIVLSFAIGPGAYAVETRFVREVLRGAAIAFVPDAPEVLAGLSICRGDLLPVVDLRPLLGLPGAAGAGGASIVVMGAEGASPLGFPVDELLDVRAIAGAELGPPPSASLAGLVRGATAAVLLLDGERLLADPRLYLQPTDERRE